MAFPAWAVSGFFVALGAQLTVGNAGVIFTIGGMIVSATWFLSRRFSKVESRVSVVETKVEDLVRDIDRRTPHP